MSIAAIGASSSALLSSPSSSSPSAIKSSSAKSYDPRDTSQDGGVSPAEEIAHAMKHPELEKSIPPASKGSSRIDLRTWVQPGPGSRMARRVRPGPPDRGVPGRPI